MKKVLLSFSMAMVLLMAESNDSLDSFTQMKNFVIESSKLTIPSMENIRECFAKANSDNEAKKCTVMMEETSKKIMKSMGIEDNATMPDNEDSNETQEPWNEENKKELLYELNQDIEEAKITLQCIKENNNIEAFEACLVKHGIEEEE